MRTQKNSSLCKAYTLLLILYPIIGIYGVFTLPVSLADLLAIMLIFYMLMIEIKNRRKDGATINFILLPYFIYIVLQIPVMMFFRNNLNEYDYIGTTGRYLLYLFILIFFYNKYFDYELGIKIYKYAAIFTTIYLILQVILIRLFGFYLKGQLNNSFFPVMRNELQNYGESLTQGGYIRPRSLFGEPAHYAAYIVGYLTINLFFFKKINWTVSFLLTIGLFFSASSTGIFVGLLIWFMFILYKLKDRISPIKLIFVVVIVLIAGIIIMQTQTYDVIYGRLEDGNSAKGRFNSYQLIYFDNWLYQFFGYGRGGLTNNNTFYPGFASLLLSYGVIGCTVFLLSIIYILFNSSISQKFLLLIFLILNIGTVLIFGSFILVYLPFLIKNLEIGSNYKGLITE